MFVMYDSSVFPVCLLSLREVRWVCMMCLSMFMSVFGFNMFVSFYMC